MKKQLALFVAAFLTIALTPIMADITVGGNGDVSPADPTTWDTSMTGYVGYQDTTDAATLTIDGNGTETSLHLGNLNIGYDASTTGQVDVSGLGASLFVYETNGAVTIGFNGAGTVNVSGYGLVDPYETYIGWNAGSTGSLNVSGESSIYSNSYHMYVGYNGDGTINLTNSGDIYAGELYMNVKAGSTAEVTLSGEGSSFEAVVLYVGQAASGSANLEITDGAYIFTTELYIDHGHNGNSFIDIARGGQLGFYDGENKISDMAGFLAAISGDAIRFWNGDEYVLYSTLTEGVDYEVVRGTGELDGYAVLTTIGNAPEPATLSLLGVGAVALLRKKRR